MQISIDISYYPLTDKYNEAIETFLHELNKDTSCEIFTGAMSTSISGEYQEVMSLLTSSMLPLMNKYASVFNLRIANACETKT
ncbi:MAG: hypothetical protein CR968_05840 [Flavobacteriia bacterium]|nr:MAG: hypothetical protein CR968_05840 [Flavobacteriia bacterium]